jgi:hypothetical protein
MTDENKIHVHVCGNGWGIGSYVYIDEEGEEQFGYGFFRPENPHDFSPDPQCCREEEIEAHKKACEEWDRKHRTRI